MYAFDCGLYSFGAFLFQDLIITKGKRKKRAYIVGGVVAIVVIAVVIALVVVFTTRSGEEEPTANESTITLEDFLNGALSPRSFNASWVSGMSIFFLIFLIY